MHVLPTLAYGRAGRCVVYVSSRVTPNAENWTKYIAWVKEQLEQTNIALVIENSAGPTAAQRRALIEIMQPYKIRSAVLMRSTLARGVLIAFSWFQPGFQAFGPDDLDGALKWLGIDAKEAGEVRKLVRDIERRIEG